ncbi:MAG: universal stress protein [Flavobacteriales bacterium]|nr:universal stress protein [Flavobacteriales bacterium]
MKNILATTDFTPDSLRAVKYAARLAMDSGARLLVLHATHIPVVSDTYFDIRVTLEELKQEDSKSLTELVKKLQEEFGPELRINKKLQVGFTNDVIRETVKNGDISLVVMGVTHSDRFSEAVFGSTSTSLAGTVDVPVLIVPDKAVYKPWNYVAFAFDQFNIPTGTGVRMLRELMDMDGSKLRFVHVNDNVFNDGDDKHLDPLYKMFKGVDMKTYFLRHSPGRTMEVLMDWVRRHKVSAVVMVARKHNLLWHIFNESHTKKVAFRAHVPVLILSEKKNH